MIDRLIFPAMMSLLLMSGIKVSEPVEAHRLGTVRINADSHTERFTMAGWKQETVQRGDDMYYLERNNRGGYWTYAKTHGVMLP